MIWPRGDLGPVPEDGSQPPRLSSNRLALQTSAAPLADGAVTMSTHEALAAKDLLPAQHLVDTGYVDAGILVETRQRSPST